jgi:hypothetical protein
MDSPDFVPIVLAGWFRVGDICDGCCTCLQSV